MGLAPLMLFTVTLLVARNPWILAAWNARQEETQRRAAAGLPPKTRRRRRKSLPVQTAAGLMTQGGHAALLAFVVFTAPVASAIERSQNES